MIKLLEQRDSWSYILAFVLALILHLFLDFSQVQHLVYGTAPWVSKYGELFTQFPWLSIILAKVVIVFQAWWWNRVVRKHRMVGKRTFYPFLFVLLFSAVFPQHQGLSLYHLANFWLILMLDEVFTLFNTKGIMLPILKMGTASGIICLVFVGGLWWSILLLALIGLFAILHPIRIWRFLLSTFMVIALFGGLAVLFEKDEWLNFNYLTPNAFYPPKMVDIFSSPMGLLFLFPLVFVIPGVVRLLGMYNRNSNKSRKVHLAMMILIGVDILWFLFSKESLATFFPVFILPFSFVASYLLAHWETRIIWKEIFFDITIVGLVLCHAFF